MGVSWRLVLIITVFLSGNYVAAEQVKRIGGDFLVEKIEGLSDGGFRVQFQHVEKSRAKTLVLISDHVHMGVQEGQLLRLSAEVLSQQDDYIEVSQVLLFMPSNYGQTPVWMLSRKQAQLQLSGARLIEMHAPAADYTIF